MQLLRFTICNNDDSLALGPGDNASLLRLICGPSSHTGDGIKLQRHHTYGSRASWSWATNLVMGYNFKASAGKRLIVSMCVNGIQALADVPTAL